MLPQSTLFALSQTNADAARYVTHEPCIRCRRMRGGTCTSSQTPMTLETDVRTLRSSSSRTSQHKMASAGWNRHGRCVAGHTALLRVC